MPTEREDGAIGGTLEDATKPKRAAGEPAPPAAEFPPVDPGCYEREQELGRGGMGQVWTALDRRLDRRVAVKELLPDRDDLRARFAREARITARLQHPSIVPVHECGVWPDGRPFYAMNLVRGRSLDQVMRSRRTLRDRLALLPNVIAVADALAYAHSQRIVHRDLKPSNIIVGEFGETVVLDWGLAKEVRAAEDDDAEPARPMPASADETVAGAVLGTPGYMAPEQARGEEVDERADVYALGAILYRLLSGERPLRSFGVTDLLERLAAEEPPRPLREHEPDVPDDLAAIVAKAMAPRPADRYPTAAPLVADLKRFEAGQLVGVHRYTARQLLARWLGRHRATVAVGGALTAALVAVSAFSVTRIIAERDVARHERAVAEAQRSSAEQLVDFMLTSLKDKLRAAGRLDALRGVGSGVVAYFDRLSVSSDVETLDRRASALGVLGDADYAQNDAGAAERSFRAALVLREQLARLRPEDDENRFRMALVRQKIGATGLMAGRLEEARAASARTLDELEPLLLRHREDREQGLVYQKSAALLARIEGELGRRDRALVVLERAARTAASMPDPVVRARAIQNLGMMQLQSDPVEARRALAEAASMTEAWAAGAPDDAQVLEVLVRVRLDQFAALQNARADDEALLAASRAVEVGERLVALDETGSDGRALLASALTAVALEDSMTGRLDAGIVAASAAVAHTERLARQQPASAFWRRSLAACRDRLGVLQFEAGRFAPAIAVLSLALGEAQALAAGSPGNPVYLHTAGVYAEHVAEAERLGGRPADAVRHVLPALAIAGELVAWSPTEWKPRVELVGSTLQLADAQQAMGEASAAAAQYARAQRLAMAIPRERGGVDRESYLAHAERGLAEDARRRAAFPEARRWAGAAVVRNEAIVADHLDQWTASDLAQSLKVQAGCDPARARDARRRARELLEPFARTGQLATVASALLAWTR